MLRTLRMLCLVSCLLMVLAAPCAAGPEATSAAAQTLKAAGQPSDGPALLEFFRRQTPSDAVQARIHQLIEQLGDSNFVVREEASKSLVAQGASAITPLRRAVKHDDREVRRRAEQCLRS